MFRRSEASRVGGIRSSFNNKGNGTQDFSNSTIIIVNGGWKRNPILNLQQVGSYKRLFQRQDPNLEPRLLRASIVVSSVIWIVQTCMIGLGRAARVVLPSSAAYANGLCSLSQGKIYVSLFSYFLTLTQNNQTCCTCVRVISVVMLKLLIPSGLKCTSEIVVIHW